MYWRCKASASSQRFLLNFPLLEERTFCYAAVPSYGDPSALDLRLFVLFYKENQLCSAVSHNKGFFQPSLLHTDFLFPPHFFIVSWRSVGTNAKCHILLSVSQVLNGQVLPSTYLYELSLCLFMQRSWHFFITHTHSRSSHWFALTLENLIVPGVTPFQLMPIPQFCRNNLYSAFVFIHEHLVTLQHISFEWAQLTSWPKSLHTTARFKYSLWARLSMWFVSASYGMVGVKGWSLGLSFGQGQVRIVLRQLQAELVSVWLCCIHHSAKMNPCKCKHVGFICSKV